MTPINWLSKIWLRCWRLSLALPFALVAILMTGYTVNAQNIKGIVPVQYPISGSGVDGDAFAHQPIGTIYEGVGDLFDSDHPTIAGHGLINPFTGEVFYKPTDPVTVPVSFFLKDPYQNDPTIFTSSNKINDNPNTYSWGAGSSPPKNEIQNCGAHFSYGDPNVTGGVSIDGLTFVSGTSGPGVATDLWCLFAGDRKVTNGSSYIDFEFLQAPLTITGASYGAVDPLTGIAPITGGSGGFTTLGTQGGRTVGDILVTIEFTQGGGDATVVIRIWTAKAGGGYEYVVHPNSEFLGEIYCTNNSVTTTVPFDTYGTFPGVYAPNQWAEGAINLTQVFTANSNPCFSLSTLFIRTRSSGNSTQSELKDFPGAPVQLNLDFTPDAPITTSATRCGPGLVDLAASGCAGGTLKWFDAAVAGNQVNTGATFSPNISQTTSYWVSCTTAGGCEGPRAQVTGTVNTIAPGTIAGSQTLCAPADPAAFTSTTDGSGGGVITYQWQSSTAGCESGFSDIAGATSATYDAPAVTVPTYFRRVATSTLNGVACSANSNCLTVSPEAINPGEIAGSQTLCTPFDPAAFTSVTPGSNSGVITYQWQISTTGCGSGFSDIAGATSETYNAPAVAVTTYFRRVATTTLNGTACPANSNCLTVTPNAINPGEVAGSQTLCTPFDPVAFTSTTAGTGGGTITYQWQSNTTGCGSAFSDIAGATSETYDAPAVAVTTYFRRVVTSTLNGVACAANSNCLTVTPNAINPGEIAGSQTLCTPADPAAFTSTAAGSGGGVITYQWQISTAGCGSGFSDIAGATSEAYDAPAVAGATYFRRVATSTLNGVACSANSNCLTITPEDITPGEIAGSQTLCTPFDPVAFTSVTPGSDGGVITYQWQISTVSCESGFSNIAEATSATYDAPAVAATTYFRRVATTSLNEAACSANSNCLTVTPNAINPGVIAGDQTVCIGDDPVAFTSTTAGTGGGVITYQWQSNTTGCDSSFSDIAGATSATYDPGVATATTYYRRVATSTLNGVVCSANSNCLTVTAEPCGGHIFPTQTTCCNFVTGTATELVNVCTTVNGGNKVTNAVPGVFFYYSNVVAPAASFTIDVKQTNDGELSKLFTIQGFNPNPNKASLSQIRLTTDNCDAVSYTASFIQNGTGAHYVVTGATPGATYVVSIKYDTKSIIGGTYSGADLSSTYTFASYINGSAIAASGSQGTINAVAGCTDNTPLPGNCSLPTAVISPAAAPIETTAKTTSDTGFDAYPVPFKDQLTIKYKFDYKSDVKIEVFNAQGISVLTKTDTNSYLNKEVTLDLKASKRQDQVYLVKVTTNRETITKKVMSSK